MNVINNRTANNDTDRFLSQIHNGSKVSITRYYAQNLTKFYMDIHWHDAAEIMYVLKGKCKIAYMDCKIRSRMWDNVYNEKSDTKSFDVEVVETELKQGQLVFFDSKVPHSMNIDGSECKILCVEMATGGRAATGFQEYKTDEGLQNDEDFTLLANKHLNYFFMSDETNVYAAIKDVQRELNLPQDELTKRMMVGIMLTRFFIELARAYKVHISGNEAVNMYVKKAVKFINDNFDTEFVVEDIAEACNIHENYLQRVFKSVTGESIVKYTNRLRMEKAEMLLLNSDMSIVDIAESVGFNSRQHFGHVFKQYNGMNPKHYREIGGSKGEVKLVE